MAVIDSSVYVSAMDPMQRAHSACRQWLADALSRGELLAAPWIIAAEVAAAVGRNTGDRALTAAAVEFLTASGVIELVAVGPDLARRAAAIAAAQRIRGCDAVFVALAAMTGDTLVTLDEEQAERAAAVISVLRPA